MSDLRDFGWAPGAYSIRCADCTPINPPPGYRHPEGDKRAWRCEPCATKAKEAARHD